MRVSNSPPPWRVTKNSSPSARLFKHSSGRSTPYECVEDDGPELEDYDFDSANLSNEVEEAAQGYGFGGFTPTGAETPQNISEADSIIKHTSSSARERVGFLRTKFEISPEATSASGGGQLG